MGPGSCPHMYQVVHAVHTAHCPLLAGAKTRADMYQAFELIYPVLQSFKKGASTPASLPAPAAPPAHQVCSLLSGRTDGCVAGGSQRLTRSAMHGRAVACSCVGCSKSSVKRCMHSMAKGSLLHPAGLSPLSCLPNSWCSQPPEECSTLWAGRCTTITAFTHCAVAGPAGATWSPAWGSWQQRARHCQLMRAGERAQL